ncbi:MAG: flagellar filament capping protein FliD [Myxococcota bacterium]
MTTVDGIVSGLDTTALINAILTAQSVPIATMKVQVSDYEKQKEAVAGVKGRFTTLSDTIKTIDTAAEFQAYKVESSSSQVAVTASSGAIAGSYAIQVDNLASAETSVSQGYDDKSAATLGTGTFSVTVGGVQTDLTIDGTNNSLQGLADALSGVDGLAAYVIDTGATTGRYKLMVQGLSTGAANSLEFDASALTGGTAPAFTENTSAVDATVQISGVTIHVASNTLDGAIPGIRIDLLQKGTTADTVKVTEDHDAMREKFKAVIDSFNAAIDYYAQQTVYNLDQDIRGPLVGEATTRRAVEDLGLMASNRYTVADTSFQALSMIGVSTGRDGKLTLDTAKFDAAFDDDPDGMVTFLTSTDGPLGVMASRIDELYVDSDTGSLVNRQEGLESTISDLNDSIAAAEDRMDSYAKILRDQFTAMETVLGQIQSTQGYLTSFFAASTTASK